MSKTEVIGIVLGVLGLLATLIAWIFPDFAHLQWGWHFVMWVGGIVLFLMGISIFKLPQLFSILRLKSKHRNAPQLPIHQPISEDATPFSEMAVFLKQSLSVSSNHDISAQREFIREWSNRTVCWKCYVGKVGLGKDGIVSNIRIKPDSSTSDWLNSVLISKYDIPNAVLPTFDVLRKDDKIWVEGTLDEVLGFPSLKPTKIERL